MCIFIKNKSHEEIRQYILEKRGVDIGSNSNFGSIMLWVLIGLAIVAGGIGIWKTYKIHQSAQKKTIKRLLMIRDTRIDNFHILFDVKYRIDF